MIWLIGNKGMLGTELSIMLKKNGINFIGTDREVDITNISVLNNFIKNKSIKWIINCAAYTAVDKAEDDFETCYNINTLGAANIAVCSNNLNANMIHISTDYVFNGKGDTPYKEDDPTDPIGNYGLTKKDGELLVLKNNSKSYIVRTAWLYGMNGKNFVHTMLSLMNERDKIKVVNDQKGSPTWAKDLAGIIINFINQTNDGNQIPYGIYHYTNNGEITWYEFAKEIYKLGIQFGIIKNKCSITSCSSNEYPSKVKRPMYSVLDKNKIKSIIQEDIPDWKISIMEFFKCHVH